MVCAADVIEAFVAEAAGGSKARCADESVQERFVAELLRHPVAVEFPPRQSYSTAVAKLFLTIVEQAIEESQDGKDEIIGDLTEFYVEMVTTPTGEGFSPITSPNRMQAPTEEEVMRNEYDLSHKSFACQWQKSGFVSVRVGPQFSNVGLSLWPSSFVMAELTIRALSNKLPPGSLHCAAQLFQQAISCADNSGGNRGLRVLELGAGVGLTAAALYGRQHFSKIDTLVLTDYQQHILANCRHNIEIAKKGVTMADSSYVSLPKVKVELFDWEEKEENERKLRAWDCDVFLGADLVYDQSALPGLSATLEQCLLTSSDDSSSGQKKKGNGRRRKFAFLVATARTADTQNMFVDLVKSSGKLEISVEEFPQELFNKNYIPGRHPQKGEEENLACGGMLGPYFVDMCGIILCYTITASN